MKIIGEENRNQEYGELLLILIKILINFKDMIISHDFFFTLIRDLIRGIVEEMIHHELITLELTQSFLNDLTNGLGVPDTLH